MKQQWQKICFYTLNHFYRIQRLLYKIQRVFTRIMYAMKFKVWENVIFKNRFKSNFAFLITFGEWHFFKTVTVIQKEDRFCQNPAAKKSKFWENAVCDDVFRILHSILRFYKIQFWFIPKVDFFSSMKVMTFNAWKNAIFNFAFMYRSLI